MSEEHDAQGGRGAPLSMQEIFDHAFRGLRAQGFQRSVRDGGGGCRYAMPDGRRCAWGHVDPSLGPEEGRNLYELARSGVGVAAQFSIGLDEDGVAAIDSHSPEYGLSLDLVRAHDGSNGSGDMRERLLSVALQYGLSIPQEDPGVPLD